MEDFIMSNFYTEPFVSAGEMEFPSEPYITAQPQNHTALGVEDYVLTVIAAGAVSYQWEVFDGESWSTIPGATSDTLTITIYPSMDGWRYRVLVTGADGSTVVSKAAQIAIRGVQEITFEGAIVTFDGPAMIKSLEIDVNPVQVGSGDPSPTNVRPISGWDEVDIVVSPTLDAEDGTTYPITLPQTVYGGKIKDGVLTIDGFLYSFTGNESFLTNSAWGDYAKLYNVGISLQSSYEIQEKCKSSHLTVTDSAGWSSLTPNRFMIAGGSFIGIGYDGTVEELKAWLTAQASANTPVQVLGLLATPTEITLSDYPTITPLSGINNMWADSGDVRVTIIR